jgi:hypothetical protein
MTQAMTVSTLACENMAFAGTGGVSNENWGFGFVPGFLDRETGWVYLARKSDGSPAPCHLLDGLPEHLVVNRGPLGLAIKATVISGFIRDGKFYTREQAASAVRLG